MTAGHVTVRRLLACFMRMPAHDFQMTLIERISDQSRRDIGRRIFVSLKVDNENCKVAFLRISITLRSPNFFELF